MSLWIIIIETIITDNVVDSETSVNKPDRPNTKSKPNPKQMAV